MDATTTPEEVLAWISAFLWGLVALVAAFYFVGSYLFEILAQKLDEPRWMAWVPGPNVYLMFRMVGWATWFWVFLGGYAAMLLTFLLPSPMSVLGMIIAIPIGLTGLVLSLGYWPKLAIRRDLPLWVGLLMVIPQFLAAVYESLHPGAWALALGATLVTLLAYLYIVFYDGGPRAAPHPLGYALTLLCALVTAGVLHTLTPKLAENPEVRTAFVAFIEALERSEAEEGSELSAKAVLEEVEQAAKPLEQALETSLGTDGPDPVRVASVCPDDTREAGRRGRDWWCETEAGGRRVRHGPARTWFASGQLESEGEYAHGARSGTWTRYWPSGVRRAQAGFRDGKQHGWMHGFDEFGQLENEVYYENGTPVSPELAAAP